jgi:hypothetical protein
MRSQVRAPCLTTTQDREHIKKATSAKCPQACARFAAHRSPGRRPYSGKSHQIPTTDAPARGEMTLVAWGMLIAAEGPGVRGGAMSHCRS